MSISSKVAHGSRLAAPVLALLAGTLLAEGAMAQVPTYHFESICRNDPAQNKNVVTAILHEDDHAPLAGATVNVLWSFVDYRQNHAVFKYRQASCVTDADGTCTFRGGSGRARWQLLDVVGYDLGDPAFDTEAMPECPNAFMIDFW